MLFFNRRDQVTNLIEYKEKTAAQQLQEELCLFDFNGHQIETVVIKDPEGKDLPLFQGKMVAEVLGYEDPEQSLKVNCMEKTRMSYLDIVKSASVYNTDLNKKQQLT